MHQNIVSDYGPESVGAKWQDGTRAKSDGLNTIRLGQHQQ